LVRAGVPIESAWERLLALDNYPFERDTLRADILAIPESRREVAIAAALARVPGHASPLHVALKLLEDFCHPSIARFALTRLDDANNPKKALKVLANLVKTDPASAEVVAAWQRGQARAQPGRDRGQALRRT
jgi:hypothetical protein